MLFYLPFYKILTYHAYGVYRQELWSGSVWFVVSIYHIIIADLL